LKAEIEQRHPEIVPGCLLDGSFGPVGRLVSCHAIQAAVHHIQQPARREVEEDVQANVLHPLDIGAAFRASHYRFGLIII
jgi:hypothetical protein